jgi:hypothetical protein
MRAEKQRSSQGGNCGRGAPRERRHAFCHAPSTDMRVCLPFLRSPSPPFLFSFALLAGLKAESNPLFG